MAKILVADHDIEYYEVIAKKLELEGHSVDFIGSLEKLIQPMMLTGRSLPDLLMAEIWLPDNPLKGIEIIRKLRSSRSWSSTRILVLSDFNTISGLPFRLSDADICDDFFPVDGYRDKSATESSLFNLVRNLLPSS